MDEIGYVLGSNLIRPVLLNKVSGSAFVEIPLGRNDLPCFLRLALTLAVIDFPGSSLLMCFVVRGGGFFARLDRTDDRSDTPLSDITLLNRGFPDFIPSFH
jgi:hypothetical protein